MLLLCNNVSIRKGEFLCTGNVTFPKGIHLITGRTGAGKTTLAEALTGCIAPVCGSITYEDIATKMLVMQNAERHVTCSQVNAEIASYGADTGVVLTRAGLSGFTDREILSLSRGELKRLILFSILSKHYDLIVLDEPYAGLDCAAKGMLSEMIAQTQSGICIILTHDLSSLPPLDQIYEIEDGKLVSHGSLPGAFDTWKMVPRSVASILNRGIRPENIDHRSLLEAACRIRE
ncbi:MAG: energy-coupling factor ABC transporter ATP-binding protein [Methanospirillaceae archaeon]|nr:energy-coupling factor ABC transporter ATP-binding protein [Methanospirillaceae archaeon]